MSIGVPVKLLHESVGHTVTIELKTGQLYRGTMLEVEDNMNIQLRNITVTERDGRTLHLEQAYIRGSHARFFIVPDMLKNAPMFKRMDPRFAKMRGIGMSRGKIMSRGLGRPRGGGISRPSR
ncbi:hypothetical protein BB558_000844 [Smittium angustum]|uniref:Small nuclear ribonucleoprotein Sm D3 n=1 Tax=Smittium angustum TaxID=133377 RepID=A0A2U1JD24_SMIAN|nr:hypothetical protein BB558_000844 [Smittium angustum]